jgi:hypothetical protein
VLGQPVEVHAQGALHELAVARLVEHARLQHLPQHDVAPCQRALRVRHGVVVRRPLQHADERGRLRFVELGRRLVEIRVRRRLDAVRVVQERHGIQVGFEDFRLAVGVLDLEGGDEFLHLAVDVARPPDLVAEHIARQLLCDRGAALRIALQVGHQRAADAGEVDAVVVVEAVVFRGDEGVDDVRRHLRQRHLHLHALLETGQLAAVRGDDDGGPRHARLPDVLDARRQGEQHRDPQCEQGHGKQEQAGRDVEPAQVRGFRHQVAVRPCVGFPGARTRAVDHAAFAPVPALAVVMVIHSRFPSASLSIRPQV